MSRTDAARRKAGFDLMQYTKDEVRQYVVEEDVKFLRSANKVPRRDREYDNVPLARPSSS